MQPDRDRWGVVTGSPVPGTVGRSNLDCIIDYPHVLVTAIIVSHLGKEITTALFNDVILIVVIDLECNQTHLDHEIEKTVRGYMHHRCAIGGKRRGERREIVRESGPFCFVGINIFGSVLHIFFEGHSVGPVFMISLDADTAGGLPIKTFLLRNVFEILVLGDVRELISGGFLCQRWTHDIHLVRREMI
jgi:hypothetical protein